MKSHLLMAGYCPCYLKLRSPNTIKAIEREKLHLDQSSCDSNATHEIQVKYFVFSRHDIILLLHTKRKRKNQKFSVRVIV